MQFIRSCLFVVGYFIFTTLYGTLSIFVRVLPPAQQQKIIVSWTHVIVFWVKVTCGLKHRLIGEEHLRQLHSPYVALSKHQCAWETFYLQGLLAPSSTILKKELLKIPFFGWGLKTLQPIAIDRSNPRDALRQVKKQGLERLAQGNNLLLFPEGTRVAIGEKVKYARSGAEIAKTAGATILPVCHNAGMFWGAKQFVKKSGLITVVIGNPISTENKTTKQITEEVERWIESTLDDILHQRI